MALYEIKEEKFLRERVEAEVKEEGEESHYKKHDTVFQRDGQQRVYRAQDRQGHRGRDTVSQ